MWNTWKSWGSDYYEVGVDSTGANFMTWERMSTDPDNRSVGMNIVIDDNCDKYAERDLKVVQPGTGGMSTFYIVPKKANRDLEIKLRFKAFGVNIDENGAPVKENTADCIKLYESRSNGEYKGEIADEYVFKTSEHKDGLHNGSYTVIVYWKWDESVDLDLDSIEGIGFEIEAVD